MAGACKAIVLLHFAAMGLHPRHVLFSFGVALGRNLVCKKIKKKSKWASGKRPGAISKRLLCIHTYLFVMQIMMCVIGSWCEADWPFGTCANFASCIFLCLLCMCGDVFWIAAGLLGFAIKMNFLF